MKLLSVCIPVYNEENNVNHAYESIKKLLDEKLVDLDYEIIFADNHSIDKTGSIIENICSKDSKVKYIRYNKNIGYDRSLLQAYINSSGDRSSIDCDLQDSPDIILKFIEKWKDIVYGVEKKIRGGLLFLEEFFIQ